MPAASSVAELNLLRLAQLRNDKQLEDRGRKSIAAFATTVNHFASAMPQLLVALDFSSSKPRQIVIAGPLPSNYGAASKIDPPSQGYDRISNEQTLALLREMNRHFLPNKILILADGGEGQKFFGEKNEAIAAMSPVDGKVAAYVCENFTCKAPVTDPKALRQLLVGH